MLKETGASLPSPFITQTPTRARLKLGAGNSSRFPMGWQGANCLSNHLPSPKVSISGELDLKGKVGLEPGDLLQARGVPSSALTVMPKSHCFILISLVTGAGSDTQQLLAKHSLINAYVANNSNWESRISEAFWNILGISELPGGPMTTPTTQGLCLPLRVWP